MAENRPVQFTFPWTDPKTKKQYEQGDVAELPDLTARRLLHGGRAREPRTPAATPGDLGIAPQAAPEAAPAPAQAPAVEQPSEAVVAPPETPAPAAAAAATSTEAVAVPSTKKGR